MISIVDVAAGLVALWALLALLDRVMPAKTRTPAPAPSPPQGASRRRLKRAPRSLLEDDTEPEQTPATAAELDGPEALVLDSSGDDEDKEHPTEGGQEEADSQSDHPDHQHHQHPNPPPPPSLVLRGWAALAPTLAPEMAARLAPCVPWVDVAWRALPRVAVALVLLAFVLFGGQLVLNDPDRLYYYGTGQTIPYLLRPYSSGSLLRRLPVVDCPHYQEAARLQDALAEAEGDPLLSDKSLASYAAARRLDPLLTEPQYQERRALQDMRRRATRWCLVRNATIQALDDPRGTYQVYLDRPVFWDTRHVAETPPALAASSRVTEVLVTKQREHYYRVLMLLPEDAAAERQQPHAQYRLRPVLVAEQELLGAADQWYKRLAKQDVHMHDYPCLCAAHFGIIGSGLYLLHDASALLAADPGEAGRVRSAWHVLVGARVISHVLSGQDSENMVETEFLWTDYRLLPFPIHVDPRYGVTNVTHARLVDVAFVEPARVSNMDIEALEPGWLVRADAAAHDEDTDGPRVVMPAPPVLAAALPLKDLVAAPGHSRRFHEETSHVCLQHCMAVEEVCEKRLHKRLLPRP